MSRICDICGKIGDGPHNWDAHQTDAVRDGNEIMGRVEEELVKLRGAVERLALVINARLPANSKEDSKP